VEQSAWAAAAVNFAVAAAAGAVSATAAIPVAKAFFDLHFGYPLCAPATERRGLHRRSSLKRQALQQHHRSLLLRLRSACLAVSRPNGNAKGAPSMKPHKLSINSHRTRNLLPAVLIGDVWNSPFGNTAGSCRCFCCSRRANEVGLCCRERKNDQQHRARPEIGNHTGAAYFAPGNCEGGV